MIIALFALAVLMIVGGVASVVQGFPFVRLESGMAMTVAGATTASAGAVVLGLAAVASHLRGLGRRLGELRLASPSAEGQSVEAVAAQTFAPDLSEPAPGDTSARQRPSLGGPGPREQAGPGGLELAGLSLGGLGVTGSLAAIGGNKAAFGAGPQGRGTEPTFAPASESERPAASESEPVEPLLPDLLPDLPPPAERPAPASPETTPIVQENDPTPGLFEPSLAAAPEEPPRLYPTLDTTTDATPEPAPRPPAIEHEPDVVGTYKSGSNTYVMFSNGVIEADTPRGRFSFGSLEELKAFVAAGGETDARGAA